MTQPSTPAATISAALEYLCPPSGRPHTYMVQPPAGQPWSNAEYERRIVSIDDARDRVRDHARSSSAAPTMEREGYALHHAPSAVCDFLDKDEVVRHYYPEVAELALAVSGASRAFVFDHLLRKRQPGAPQGFGRIDGHRPGAAGRVHCDFTPASARRRLELELGGADAANKVKRYSIVNLWRPIRHPVLDAPLAMCDARSVAPDDLVASDIIYADRTGEIYQALHNPTHRWSYFSAMTRDEVLIFKQYDALYTDGIAKDVAKPTPHAAFEHPHAPDDAPPREGIEIRCLLIYND